MLFYKAKYNHAKVFIDVIDEETVRQIYSFLNHPAFANSKIRIMPDCHAGKGAVVGFTMEMNDYVIPNVVGVDIGCGMLMTRIDVDKIDFEKLDDFIHVNIPSGFSYNDVKRNGLNLDNQVVDDFLRVANKINQDNNTTIASLGTLGGGNHFIEVNASDEGFFVVVHSGSRNFGLKVCQYHQNKAKDLMKKMFIGDAYKDAEFLPMDDGGTEYLNDMQIAQKYASLNRKLMLSKIMKEFFKINDYREFECIHNYINFDDKIIRKGAISAHAGELVIIPLNMRDGIIVGYGRGNDDWNNSAPHGAGRILSRKQAKAEISLDDFQKSMDGIYTTSVNANTIDESPMAYKDKDLIIDAIKDTVDIEFIMKPVYNFKAGGD